MKAFLFRIAAILCIILGLIGALLPVMPTVPFLLAALYFGAEDPAIKKYIRNNRLLALYMQDRSEFAQLPKRKKIFMLAFIYLSLMISFLLTDILWCRVLLAAVGAVLSWFLLLRKNPTKQ